MEKPDRYHINHVIKVKITSNETCQHTASPDMIWRVGHSTISVVLLLKKKAYSEFNHDEALGKLKLRVILKVKIIVLRTT